MFTFRQSISNTISALSGLYQPNHSYDKLVIAVGSTSSTHGVPGLENCLQLKTVGDALKMRQRIIGTLFDP